MVSGIEALRDIDDMSDRLEQAFEIAPGNIVEIGGGEGINTIRFLLTAREKKTTVIVVDPFEKIAGADDSYFKPYTRDEFYNNIAKKSEYLADHLHLIDLPSQNAQVHRRLKEFVPIGFMFIDGLQDTQSVLSDLRLAEALEAEIICADDYNRLTRTSQVPLAVTEFLKTTKYKMIDIGKREVYFVK